MSAPPLGVVVRHLRRAASTKAEPTPDADLLARFTGRNDQAAFAGLVERHGPMVLGVCRSVLRHHHDAEDAFQLGWGRAVLRGRLERGRKLVRGRLSRRGLALSAGLLTTVLGRAAALPAGLAESATTAAARLAAGEAVAVPARVAALAEGV